MIKRSSKRSSGFQEGLLLVLEWMLNEALAKTAHGEFAKGSLRLKHIAFPFTFNFMAALSKLEFPHESCTVHAYTHVYTRV